MISREEIKSQFDSVSEQLKGQISTLPESTSLLINFLVATFNKSFELSSNQNDNLQASIDSLKQTMKQQTQTIEQQTKKIQELLDFF